MQAVTIIRGLITIWMMSGLIFLPYATYLMVKADLFRSNRKSDNDKWQRTQRRDSVLRILNLNSHYPFIIFICGALFYMGIFGFALTYAFIFIYNTIWN